MSGSDLCLDAPQSVRLRVVSKLLGSNYARAPLDSAGTATHGVKGILQNLDWTLDFGLDFGLVQSNFLNLKRQKLKTVSQLYVLSIYTFAVGFQCNNTPF